MILFRISNQNGAPSVAATAVKSQPRAGANTSFHGRTCPPGEGNGSKWLEVRVEPVNGAPQPFDQPMGSPSSFNFVCSASGVFISLVALVLAATFSACVTTVERTASCRYR